MSLIDLPDQAFTKGPLLVDPSSKRVSFKGKEIPFTECEFLIFNRLVSYLGKPVDRDILLESLYGCYVPQVTRTVDVHIASIRKKLKHFSNLLILTVYRKGYVLFLKN